MQFLVRWIAPHEAAIAETLMEAADEAALRARLQAQGARVLSLSRAGGAPRAAPASERGFDVAAWCRELATLLRAGMTAVEAIETLQLQRDQRGAARQARLLAA